MAEIFVAIEVILIHTNEVIVNMDVPSVGSSETD